MLMQIGWPPEKLNTNSLLHNLMVITFGEVMKKKITQEEFLSRSVAVHGDKYIYSESFYSGTDFKIKIICPSHGNFYQSPHKHINRRNGCPSCSKRKKLTTAEFIDKSKSIHGNKFSYSKSEYVDSKSKIIVTCSTHGDVLISPLNHYKKHGCGKCGNESRDSYKVKGFDFFINKVRGIHGDRYKYVRESYISTGDNLSIICHSHGEFLMTPSNHYAGQGCPSCASHGFDKNKDSFIYILESDDFMKIGITNNAENRVVQLKRSTPFSFSVSRLFSVRGDNARRIEGIIHSMAIRAGFEGFNGCTEWFIIDGSVIHAADEMKELKVINK